MYATYERAFLMFSIYWTAFVAYFTVVEFCIKECYALKIVRPPQ